MNKKGNILDICGVFSIPQNSKGTMFTNLFLSKSAVTSKIIVILVTKSSKNQHNKNCGSSEIRFNNITNDYFNNKFFLKI